MDTIVPNHGVAPAPFPAANGAGRRLACRVREVLVAAGFACDDVCALGDDWGFLVEPECTPVGVTVARATAAAWSVSVSYEGGLSALWGTDRRREGRVLLARVEAAIRGVLGGTPAQ